MKEVKLDFKVGDKVSIVLGKFKGLTGTIINIRKDPFFDCIRAIDKVYGVEFNQKIEGGHNAGFNASLASLVDGVETGKEGYCYNFNIYDIQPAKAHRIAYCKFKDNNLPYTFLNDIVDLEVNDTVVVDTRYGYSLATVYMLTNEDDVKATKMVVCKVDTKSFEEKRDAYVKKVEDERRREEKKKKLFDEMKDVFASNCEMAQFKKMAKKSPEMAKLIKIYEDVENGKWKPEDDLPF